MGIIGTKHRSPVHHPGKQPGSNVTTRIQSIPAKPHTNHSYRKSHAQREKMRGKFKGVFGSCQGKNNKEKLASPWLTAYVMGVEGSRLTMAEAVTSPPNSDQLFRPGKAGGT